jgi:hypothetical protein
MHNRLALPVLLLILTASVAAQEHRSLVLGGHLKSEEYLALQPEEQAAYAMGLLDGINLAPVFDASNTNKYLSSFQTCVRDMTGVQVAAIITKYVKERPEQWHFPINLIAYEAVRKVCPVSPAGH